MSTTNRDICIESAVPVVSINTLLATNQPVDFSNAPSCALPGATTIGGSAVVALANISSVATTGAVFSTTTTGVYTGVGVNQIIANSLTSGVENLFTATGLTTGTIVKAVATAATMTTGRYYSANDTTNGEVFGIGTNGHIISTAGSAPSILITAQQGITACALAAGATDTCGTITTTGTQNNTADSTMTLTFGKTYTSIPKCVILSAANASAGIAGAGEAYVSSISATAVVIGIGKSAASGATPSYCYMIIA